MLRFVVHYLVFCHQRYSGYLQNMCSILMINADKQVTNIFPAFSISNIICKIVQHLNLLLVLFLIFSINIYCKLSKILKPSED